ncbi:hypothetical protein Tco_0261877 [Tanacetum coccineum]
MAPLPPRNQRHLWLRYQVEGYTEEIRHDFDDQLQTIFERQVNRVLVLDFEGLTPKIRQDSAKRLRMVYTRDDGQEIFMSLHTAEEMAEDRFEAYWLGSERVIPDKGDLSDYWIEISSDRDFLRAAPSYTYIRDPMRRLCHRYAEGRKSGSKLSGGHFIGRLAHHFGLVSDDELRELSVGAERQPVDAVVAPRGAKDALDIDEGAQAVPTPINAPPPPPPAAGRTMPQRLGRLEEEIQELRQDVGSLRGLVERLMTDQGRFSTWMISCMTQLMEASRRTYQAFDSAKRAIHNEPAAVGPGKVVVGPSTAVVGPVVAPNGKLLVLVSDDTKGY